MHNFKDLNIKPQIKVFLGDKIEVKKILNVQIKVLAFKIDPSKIEGGGECLTLQIEKSAGEPRVVFVGSKVLIDQINRVPKEKFPFTTIIKADNNYYEFT